MVDAFADFLVDKKFECSVKKWLNTLSTEDQQNYLIIEQRYRTGANITVSAIYAALLAELETLPFKLTSFRTHMNGACTCQRN